MNNQDITILIAEDDDDDYFFIKKAFGKSKLANPHQRVLNGRELLDKLAEMKESGDFVGLILLDLNMPIMDGREFLEIVKKDPRFKRIPVVIMTTSKAEEDVARSYDLGANAYIQKPLDVESMIEVVSALENFWIKIVEIPKA